MPARRILLEDAVAQDRDVETMEHLDALRALFPGDEKRLFFVAEAYDAIGREDLRLATLKSAIDIAPESAIAPVRYGRALLRNGQTDAAARRLPHGPQVLASGRGDARVARADRAREARGRGLRGGQRDHPQAPPGLEQSSGGRVAGPSP